MRTATAHGRAKVDQRTILAAVAMLLGVVSLGYGVFQNDSLWTYAGIALLLIGVFIEVVFGIILQRRRLPGKNART
jgi:hypothetical protein